MSDTERDGARMDQTEASVAGAPVADVIGPQDDIVTKDGGIADSRTSEQTAPRDDLFDAPIPNPPIPAVHSGASGTASMVVGGILAAAVGAAVALTVLPEGWRAHDTSALERRIQALEDGNGGLSAIDLRAALAPVQARIGALEDAETPDIAPLAARIATLEGAAGIDTQALAAALAPLATRIAQIEAESQAQARAAVEEALAEARAEVQTQAAALATRETTVEAAQARIAARAALAELVAAAESGAGVPEALAILSQGSEPPAALAAFAEGLTTLSALQDAFAPAARAALTAQGPAPDAAIGDRVLTFLRAQTGARSLAPRDGDDTDAVLSRAEAALRQGDVAGTLAELDGLTEAPATEMIAWRALAEARLVALAALTALQNQLTGSEG